MRGCLVLHGLGGGPYEVDPLIQGMSECGFTVHAPMLPGHEGPGPRMPASTWPEWAAASEAAFDLLAREASPVAVVGFSTGGTLALRLATTRPVARLVLLSPFLEIRYTRLLPVAAIRYVRPLSRLIPSLPRRRPAVRDPESLRRVVASAGFRTFSVRAAASALELIEATRPLLPAISVPTLILQGALDSVVEPRGARRILEELGSDWKRLLTLPSSDHLIALDRERDVVRREVVAFLRGDPGLRGGEPSSTRPQASPSQGIRQE
ncbi:alpha/beta hydrolase [Aquisphaera giovannonii]|uniref:alpha/beta hydrolase n=1 Tax=Aquisphaera giovannonii TaxID=406548 RepID=UPI00143DCD75|nr:alpha/beta fold hydrolase [Aquisphaera giovannonii]